MVGTVYVEWPDLGELMESLSLAPSANCTKTSTSNNKKETNPFILELKAAEIPMFGDSTNSTSKIWPDLTILAFHLSSFRK